MVARETLTSRVTLPPITGTLVVSTDERDALIEVDGRSFLIVHGEGGTRIRRVSSRAAVMAQSLKEAQS